MKIELKGNGDVLDQRHLDLLTVHGRILVELARQPTISQECLARCLQLAMRTVQRHLSELEERGWVTVDRGKRPFEYTLDWSRTWPEVPWLRLIVLHPATCAAFSGLSDLSLRAYQSALDSGADPALALGDLMAAPAASSLR